MAVTGADNQTNIWDFSVESDESNNNEKISSIAINNEEQMHKDNINNNGDSDGRPAKQPILEKVTVPSQLMFIHQGQEDLKECWHPHYQGVLTTTSHSGFNILKTFNI